VAFEKCSAIGLRRRIEKSQTHHRLCSQAWFATATKGIGKHQRLMHDFTRYWSRRITDDHRGFRGLVLGSVSQHVAGYAKCSVTIVR
jgi:hypothetical protein